MNITNKHYVSNLKLEYFMEIDDMLYSVFCLVNLGNVYVICMGC